MPELRAQVDVQGAPSNRLRLIATSGSASINYSYSGLPWRVSNFDNPARTLIGLGPLPNTPPDSIVHAGSYYWQITNTGLANVTVSLSVPYLIGYDSPNDPDRLGITNGLDPLTASAGDLRPYLRWLVRYQNLLSYNANLAWTAIGGTITNDSLVSVSFTPTESLIELALGDTYSVKDDPGHDDNPLPVELTAFNGASTSAGIKLNWTTQSETDNAGFVLLRNGQEVASHTNTTALKGQGTKSGVTNYTYTDMEAELGLTYTYKLRSVDLSGQTHDYPRTVSVKMTEAVPGKTYNYDLSQNYPNPFNPSTTILYQMKEAGIAKLVVYDVLGREVVSRALQANKGWNEYKFNAASLGSGVYFYRLSVGGQFDKTMKMMLMK